MNDPCNGQFNLESLTNIRQRLQSQAEDIEGFDTAPAELQDNLLSVGAFIIKAVSDYALTSTQSLRPPFQNDKDLLAYATGLGIERKKGTGNTVQLTFSGTQGTFIPQATKVEDASNTLSFETESSAVVLSTGQVTVRAFSTNLVIAPVNSLTVVNPSIPNITSVTNLDPSQIVEQETDKELRNRVYNRAKALSGTGGDVLLLTNLLLIEGVQERLIGVATPVVSGARQLQVTIVGGDDASVAGAIFISTDIPTTTGSAKPVGDPQYRSIDILSGSNSFEIIFTRGLLVSIDVRITYQVQNESGITNSAFEARATAGALDYLQDIRIGSFVNKSTIQYNIRNALLNDADGRIIQDIQNLTRLDIFVDINGIPDPETSAVIELNDDQYFNIDANDFTYTRIGG